MTGTRYAIRLAMRGLLASGLLVALGAGAIAAQSPLHQEVKVDFQFSAASEELPAGSYHVKMSKDNAGQVELILLGDGTETRLPVVTRLATIGKSTSWTRFVFDRSGDKHVLSEVWLPTFDGFLVNVTKGEHGHDVVDEVTGN